MAAATGSLIMGMSSISSSIAQASAQRSQAQYQQQVSEINSRLADQQAEDAVARGTKQANAIRKQSEKVKGAQRAAAAAQGIAVDSGDIADLQAETDINSAEDQKTTMTNAWREAFGYKVEAANAAAAGQFAATAGKFAAKSTVLTGGMQALGYGAEGLAKSERAKKEAAK